MLNEGFCRYARWAGKRIPILFMRDAVIHNHLPPIESLEDILPTAGFICLALYQRYYGEQKIAEIFGRMKMPAERRNGILSSIGLSIKDLSDDGKRKKGFITGRIAKREEPSEFSFVVDRIIRRKAIFTTQAPHSPRSDPMHFFPHRTIIRYFLMSASPVRSLKNSFRDSGQKFRRTSSSHSGTRMVA